MLYTLLAKVYGFPELLDFLPVTWFSDMPKGEDSEYYKVVPSSEKSYSALYTALAGLALVLVGCLLMYVKKAG